MRDDERGFTLLEVVVSIAVISIVLTSMTVFFQRTLTLGHHYTEREDAVRVATTALEMAAGLGGDQILTGRDRASVQGQTLAPGVTGYLDDAEQAWDDEAEPGDGADAEVPTAPSPIVLNDVTYTRHWYVRICRRAADSPYTCKAANTGVAYLRLVVAVQWPGKECADGVCVYFLSTLINAADDPVFPLPPSPSPSASASVSSSPSVSPAVSAAPSGTVSATPSASPSAAGSLAAVWANRATDGANPAALWLASATITVTGLVHTNSDLYLAGTGMTLSPTVEYVTKQTVSGSGTVPTPVKVTASTPVGVRAVADYAPGGTLAVAAGAGYHSVTCTSGTWTYSAGAVPSTATVVYVPCAVNVTTDVTPLLVATGAISVASSSLTVGTAATAKSSGLLSASTTDPAINISGSHTTVYGNVQALSGGVQLLGAFGVFRCGIVGDTVQVRGSDITITADSTCR